MPPKTRIVAAVTGSCLLLVVLLGIGPVLTGLTASAGLTVVPSALGAPLYLPGLRVTPLGDTPWAVTLSESFAALLLVATAALVMRRHLRGRPVGSRGRRLAVGWWALVAGAAVAGVFRGLVMARLTESGVMGWFGYAVAGVLCGALWGVVLGWLPGLAALASTGAEGGSGGGAAGAGGIRAGTERADGR
ncbi:hypothetical protein [Streptomyces sp. NPDC003077]|uniref:hypothetical protein n=1 Tax=Streptomyces sp. NPDC003077 TaxID=3154443 RepID=UPI0033A83EE2